MICSQCNNGFLTESLPESFKLSYRGFTKVIGTSVYLECGNGCNLSTEPSRVIVDGAMEELVKEFKREVNIKLSIGEEL